jgi:hypothetical protein
VLFHVVGPESKSGLSISIGLLRTISDSLSLVRMPIFAPLAGWF